MKIYKLNTNSQFLDKNINLTIGNFDGLHLGHKKIIQELIQVSKKNLLQSAILSFNPHPREFFSEFNESFNIITLENKKKLIENLGLDIFIEFIFNDSLASLHPEEFIKNILVEKLSIKNLIVGKDFKFGKDRRGDINLLKEKGKKYNFNLILIDPILEKNNNEKFSSSLIRKQIKNGEFEKVNNALGRNWNIIGNVIMGDQKAREMNFPTANIEPGNYIWPLKGVYCVLVIINGKTYKGISNFGERPTVNGNKILLETHIFNFNDDIYGKELTIEFLTFIREEKKFDSFDKLTEQIKKDIHIAKTYHKI